MKRAFALTVSLLFMASVAGVSAAPARSSRSRIAAPAAQPSPAVQRGRVKQLANNGESFQLICRGGAGLQVRDSAWLIPTDPTGFTPCETNYLGGCVSRRYAWSLSFNRSSRAPDPAGRNLQPGECSPAGFAWRIIDKAEIQIDVSNYGSLPGLSLYPWEKPDADINTDAWKRVQQYLDFMKSPANYWSFDVQGTVGLIYSPSNESDYAAGDYFHVQSSQYWKPEFYRGPTVTAVESIRSDPARTFAMGGPPPPAPPPAPINAANLDALAARGEPIANQDPLAAELRSRMPEGPALRGFDIGMAAAEGNTAPGPGKQRIHDALIPEEQGGFDLAVSFSLQRNKNAQLAATGAAIALADLDVAQARTVDGDVFYWLGFDIASGVFGDPALGALGNTAAGPGSLAIRGGLSPAAQKGFNASMAMHLGRTYRR